MKIKEYQSYNVLEATRQRIKTTFDEFERVYVSFSGGKDSTVMIHLVAEEAIKRGRTFGVLIIDLEAQYADTITHLHAVIDMYKEIIDFALGSHSDAFEKCRF